jgi:hypothetical protein
MHQCCRGQQQQQQQEQAGLAIKKPTQKNPPKKTHKMGLWVFWVF